MVVVNGYYLKLVELDTRTEDKCKKVIKSYYVQINLCTIC